MRVRHLLGRPARVWRDFSLLRELAPASPPAMVRLVSRYALLRLRLARASVRGSCLLPEGLVLFWCASRYPRTGPILEVGSAFGLSTILLASAGGELVSVDPHTGEGCTQPEDSHDEFRRNLERFGLAGRVAVHRMTSREAARRYEGPALGLVYVDGLHTYEGVRRDIADWLPFVEPGGLVVFDDYANPDWPGVARAVDEAAERGDLSQPRRLYALAMARRL